MAKPKPLESSTEAFLSAKPAAESPPSEPPAERLEPSKPPGELSQTLNAAWVDLRFEQVFDRLIALEKAMSTVLHASSEPPPPPSIESIEQALLEDVARLERGELTADEHEALAGRLSNFASDLQRRAIKFFALTRQIRGG